MTNIETILADASLKARFIETFKGDHALPYCKLSYDTGVDFDNDLFEVHSFSRKHQNFVHPEKIGIAGYNADKGIIFSKEGVGLRRKIDTGYAFPLSCYQHGNCVWSLQGEGNRCRFDSCSFAGLLVFNADSGCRKWYAKKDIEARAEIARNFLSKYNDWLNGEVFVVDAFGDTVGGFIGDDETMSYIAGQVQYHIANLLGEPLGTILTVSDVYRMMEDGWLTVEVRR